MVGTTLTFKQKRCNSQF